MIAEIPIYIAVTVAGCCSNVYIFEKLLHVSSQITTLITFSQYLFIFVLMSIYLWYVRFWDEFTETITIKNENDVVQEVQITRKRTIYDTFSYEFMIPLVGQVVSSHLNNDVFRYDLPMPTHIIFRSSQAVSTLFFGWCFWHKTYGILKIVGSALIAIGVVLFTLDVQIKPQADATAQQNSIIGISILMVITVMNSLCSLYKEQVYQRKDQTDPTLIRFDWKEIVYYNHMFGLIFYIPMCTQIYKEFCTFKDIVDVVQDGHVMGMLFYNWVTQLVCIVGVNVLLFKVTALTLTIILLVKRFLSLLLSIVMFKAPVGTKGYMGIAFVFAGAVTYSYRKRGT
jgi:solute carrier family 35 (UDP-xylose/UDP-N-acetylglucosamine transporter), member B4